MSQDQGLNQKKYINLGGNLVDMHIPRVMGIVNSTPDSFYDGGRYAPLEAALQQAGMLLEAGADIIDVGGYSTRPGASEVVEAEELQRVIPLVEALVREYPGICISVDTFRSAVARKALDAGAQLINDISGGSGDPAMPHVVAACGVPYVLMHIPGTPASMHQVDAGADIVADMARYFSMQLEVVYRMGVKDVLLDPGFGFGKTLEQNYQLLHHIGYFRQLFGLPVLVGVSRKSMISRVVGTGPGDALPGTLAAQTLALLQGASVLRVHDVAEARQCVKLYNYYLSLR